MCNQMKVVSQKVFDEKADELNSKRENMEEKCFRKSKSGELVRKSLFEENTTKWKDEWDYIKSNVSEIYGEIFSLEIVDGKEISKLNSKAKDEIVQEIYELEAKPSYKTNTLFWGQMAEANYLKCKEEFENMTVEEENSSTPSSSKVEDYNNNSDCSEEDLKDLKSNKGK